MEIQRRASPRFQNLPNGDNSNSEKIWNSTEIQRRVSPRFQNLPIVGNTDNVKRWNTADSVKTSDTGASPNSNNEKIWNAVDSAKTSNVRVRVSPRFQNLPNIDKSNVEKIRDATDSRKTINTTVSSGLQNLPNGDDSNIEEIQNVPDSAKTSNIRVSPRFQNLPNIDKSNIEKIRVATDSRNTINTTVSSGLQNLPNGGNSNIEEIQNVPDSRKASNIRVSPRFQNQPNIDKSNIEKIRDATDSRKTINTTVSSGLQNLPNGGNSNIEEIQNVPDSRKASNTRVSPRLQSIPLEKRPYYGSSQKRKTLGDSQDELMVKKHKVANTKLEIAPHGSVTFANGRKNVAGAHKTGPIAVHGISVSMAVKEKLRLFTKYFLHFSKQEDERCNGVNGSASDQGIANGKTNDTENACEDHVETSKRKHHVKLSKRKRSFKLSRRPDLKAISEMLNKNEVLCHDRCFGHLPGIEVGNRFYSRAEMVAVGLHKLLVKGIDYIGKPYVESEYSDYTFPLAAAIVLSGQYEDDFDNREEIVYTGEGGNDLLGNKRQVKDQVMLRGNLALKNNKEQSVPVRVIRGHKCDDSYSKRLYIYDGLYQVTDYWEEKGKAGFKIFKYKLKRLPGQNNLTSQNQVHFVRRNVSRAHQDLPGIVCKDIANGQEDKCIPAFNLYNSSVAPTGFKYIKSIQVAKNVSIPPDAPGCKCRGKCTNPRSCSCARLNGGDFPYVSRDGGRLLEAKDVVFECGPNCGCGPECVNRASQRGLKYNLEIYHTKDKGWAVRSSDFIPSGGPVCEYVGIIRKNNELDNISENDYIFEIDCWHTMKGIEGRERRLGDVSLPMPNLVDEDEKALENEPEFCIDASSSGNVARFINHSCDPNLFVQCIVSSHHDLRLARVVLFAADNIPRMQELTYDYNYAMDSVIGPDGKTKQLPCFCGTADCRKRLY